MTLARVKRRALDYDVPGGYTALSFVLNVADVDAQVNFMREVFEETEVVQMEKDAQGSTIAAHVQLCDSVLMIRKEPDQSRQAKNMIMIFPLRPGDAYKKALKLGAKSFMDTGDFDNETADWGFVDKQGTRWWIRYYEDHGPGMTWKKKLWIYALVPIKLPIYVFYKYILRRDL